MGDMGVCVGYGYLWGIWISDRDIDILGIWISVGGMDICGGKWISWGDMDIWGAIIKPIITLHQLYSETIITKASQH